MKRSGPAGFTLTETMVVIVVMMVVAAISVPVLARAKAGALTRQSIHQMQQIYTAIQIYRSDHDANESDWTSSYSLGLPPDHTFLDSAYGVNESLWRSPFQVSQDIFDGSVGGELGHINYAAQGYRPDYKNSLYFIDRYLERYRENALLLSDAYCNPSGTDMINPFIKKRALGILISGRVVNELKTGNAAMLYFYSEPSDN